MTFGGTIVFQEFAINRVDSCVVNDGDADFGAGYFFAGQYRPGKLRQPAAVDA